MNLGLRWPCENLGTGNRLRMPKSAIAEQTVVLMASTLRAQRRPTFSRRTSTMKGKTKPVDGLSVAICAERGR